MLNKSMPWCDTTYYFFNSSWFMFIVARFVLNVAQQKTAHRYVNIKLH